MNGYFRELVLTAGVGFEDDIRFNDIPNTGYVSFLLGFGGFTWEPDLSRHFH